MVVELDATHDALHQLKEEAVRSGVLGRHLDELIDSILRVFSLEYPLQLWMKNECDVVDDPRAALARKLLDVPQWKWSRWERRPRVDDIQEVDDDDDEEYVKQVWSVDCLFWKHLHHLSLDEHELAILLHEFAPNTTHGGVAFVKRVTIEAVPC